MRRRLFVGMIVLGAGAAFVAPLVAQDAGAVDLDAVTERIGTEIARLLEETGNPAISIALVLDGDVAWTGAYGFANVGARVPATTDTYFSTGSTFKFVTATAIMQLVEAGHLALDTPLNEFVGPDLAIAGAGDVTFRHMLSHESGLEGPVGIVPLWSRLAPITPLEILEGTVRTGPPGTEYRYCNECYGIMAYVIEKITGQAYDAYVARSILQPLGIDVATPSVPTPEVVEHLALPYDLQNNKSVPLAQVRYDVFSAGDIYLRAEDMARFLAAQLNGGIYRGKRILSEASVREMGRRQFEAQAYGLGTGVVEQNGRVLIQHGGAIPGFNSISVGEPETRMGVYIMANSGSVTPALGQLANLAMGLLRGESVEPLPSFAAEIIPEVAVDPATFDQYVGDYELSPTMVLSVSREGSRFYVVAANQTPIEIFASSDVDFFLKAVKADLTFGRDDANGPITHMTFRQGPERRANKIR